MVYAHGVSGKYDVYPPGRDIRPLRLGEVPGEPVVLPPMGHGPHEGPRRIVAKPPPRIRRMQLQCQDRCHDCGLLIGIDCECGWNERE